MPPGYETGPRKRYPVLYMHDGQNLFNDRLAFSGVSWAVHEKVEHMMRDGEIEGVIIVGIWNTPKRILAQTIHRCDLPHALAAGFHVYDGFEHGRTGHAVCAL